MSGQNSAANFSGASNINTGQAWSITRLSESSRRAKLHMHILETGINSGLSSFMAHHKVLNHLITKKDFVVSGAGRAGKRNSQEKTLHLQMI